MQQKKGACEKISVKLAIQPWSSMIKYKIIGGLLLWQTEKKKFTNQNQ